VCVCVLLYVCASVDYVCPRYSRASPCTLLLFSARMRVVCHTTYYHSNNNLCAWVLLLSGVWPVSTFLAGVALGAIAVVLGKRR